MTTTTEQISMTEEEVKKDKLCWSVFASTSSSVSIAGLLLYVSGIRNFGAILLSFGIQVLIIAFLFYCWTRCWRRIKPEEKALDPPPPYKNEWRVAYLTARRFIEGSAQASSETADENVERATDVKFPDTEILPSECSPEASAISHSEIELHTQRRDEHAVPIEHSDSEVDARNQVGASNLPSQEEIAAAWRTVNMLTPEQIELSGLDLFYKTHPEANYIPESHNSISARNQVGASNLPTHEEIAAAWRTLNMLTPEQIELSGLDLFYKTHPEAHYIPESHNSDLPSYEEALARCKVNDIRDDPPEYSR